MSPPLTGGRETAKLNSKCVFSLRQFRTKPQPLRGGAFFFARVTGATLIAHGTEETKSQGRGNIRLANTPRRDLLLSTNKVHQEISQRARKICLTCSIHNLSHSQFERKRTDQALIHLGSPRLFPKVPLLYLYGGRSTSCRY